MGRRTWNSIIGHTVTDVVQYDTGDGACYVLVFDNGTMLGAEDSEYGGSAFYLHTKLSIRQIRGMIRRYGRKDSDTAAMLERLTALEKARSK